MVSNQLHRNYQTNVQKIGNALTPPLVDTSQHCSIQNLSLRGHCDIVKESMVCVDQTILAIVLGCCISVFVMMIPIKTLRICCTECLIHVLKMNLLTAAENLLQKKMKEKNYSILANEAADSAMKQQMAIILRFADKNDIIREELNTLIYTLIPVPLHLVCLL